MKKTRSIKSRDTVPLSHRTNRKRIVSFLKERVGVTGTNFYLLTQQNKQYSAFHGENLVHLEKLTAGGKTEKNTYLV
jgi:hypothetical protein